MIDYLFILIYNSVLNVRFVCTSEIKFYSSYQILIGHRNVTTHYYSFAHFIPNMIDKRMISNNKRCRALRSLTYTFINHKFVSHIFKELIYFWHKHIWIHQLLPVVLAASVYLNQWDFNERLLNFLNFTFWYIQIYDFDAHPVLHLFIW